MATLMPEHISELLPDPRGAGGKGVVHQLQDNYDELRRLATFLLQGERVNHTLQPTALVHEAYLRLAAQKSQGPYTRTEFLAAAAVVMRRILVDYARWRRASKRGGGRAASSLDQAFWSYEERAGDLLAVDEALRRMASVNERMSRIVELRFFGGMTMAEIAQHLGVPLRTAERGWTMAKAWLMSALHAE